MEMDGHVKRRNNIRKIGLQMELLPGKGIGETEAEEEIIMNVMKKDYTSSWG